MQKKICLMTLLFAVVCWPSLTASAQEEKSDLKTAAVDISKVFSEYEKTREGRVELEQQRSERQEVLIKMEKALKKLELELEVLEGEEKMKKKAEFDAKRKKYTAYYTVNTKELQEKQCGLWKEIYNEILDEIKSIAEKRGYDLVLKTDDDPVSGQTLEEVQLRVDIKKVLFHSPRVDLTGEVINVLNEKYKKTQKDKEDGA